MGRIGVLAVVVLLCSAASALASGLTLVPIAGPGSTLPFKSPGGLGPTFVASPPGDTHRVFVGTKDGYIYVIDDGVLQPTPFLDLHAQVSTYAEDGMFSMVFDPSYATNRRFYVDYSDTADPSATSLHDNFHLDAFQTSAGNPDVADPATETQILMVPTTNCSVATGSHFGAQLQFGPDGHLWLTIGDGSDGCNDDLGATNLDSLHGKLLRIDPQPTQPPDSNGNRYTIPADNPLVGQSGVRTEVWAYGLRNPWRFSFDPTNGNVIIGDVGGDIQDEIDDVPSALAPGAPPPFFGWPCLEGTYTTPSITCPVTQTPTAPVITFVHGTNGNGNPLCTAVIGGYVLEDASLGGDYGGRYLYGYFCAARIPGYGGELLSTDLNSAAPVTRDEGVGVGFGLSSFGEDACGHPYALNVTAGGLWRIEGPTPGPCGEFTPPHTTLVSPPSGIVHSPGQPIAFSSNIVGSTFTCSLDGAPAQPCSSPMTYSGLTDGPHTVLVTAIDQAGNADRTPPTASWIVDTGPPTTTIASAPPAKTTLRSAAISFTASESDVTFACSLDGVPAQACTSPVGYTDLGEGKHSVRVTATDAAGNVEATPAVATWVVVPPPLHIVFEIGRTLVVGANGRLRVTLHSISHKAKGTLTLLSGTTRLMPPMHFRVGAAKPITVLVVVPPWLRRTLARHHGMRLRILLTLVAADGQSGRATTTAQVQARPAAIHKRASALRVRAEAGPLADILGPLAFRPLL